MINKIYIILPVYNEGKSIYALLETYKDFFETQNYADYEIIIINDCSTDDTDKWILNAKEDFSALNLNYIKHSENRGLQGTLLTGLLNIKTMNKNTVLVIMDGDNTHNPFLIKEMINKINEGADIVIASRYCVQSRITGLSWYRIFLTEVARYLYSIMWNIPGVRDYTCGYRTYKGDLIKKYIDFYGENIIQEQGFTASAEILKKLNRFKPVIVEVPMILKYSNKFNNSSMNVLKTIFLTLKMLFSRNKY